ncbi:hypothetical protein SRHO_G00308350 [Serrasalmus rhombeus]
MEQASSLCGGVSLLHTMADGKHHYEVRNVLAHIQRKFFRKGDKILMINGVKTKDLPPKEFANMLCSRSPSLTIHQASIDTGIKECLECDSIIPYSKEEITLHFRMAMVREECLEGEENGVDPAMCEWESDYTEDDQELLLVSMNETSVAVMSGRGCDPENPCDSCGSQGCNLNEVVVVADSCQVTSVGSEYMKYDHVKREEMINLVRYHRSNTSFVTAPINVYYYTDLNQNNYIGKPVVLEIKETKEFLKCTCESQKVVLKSECCDEKKLKEEMLSFVFYMKTLKDDTKQFESAAHRENEGSIPSEVMALYDYSAEKPEELSLVKGNIYISLEKPSDDWWIVRDTDG